MVPLLGLRKTSLIDFPGRVAAVLFFPGCDFRCPYCQNAGLVLGREEGLVPAEEALALVEARAGLISGVVLSGGEALLHPELPALAERLKARGLAVKLDTNGSEPSRLRDFPADYVALDLKTAPSAYHRVAPGLPDAGERVLESLAWLRSSGLPYEVRITLAPGVVGLEEAEEVAAILAPGDPVILQPFRPGDCLDPRWDGKPPLGAEATNQVLALLSEVAPLARLRGGGT